MKVKLAFVYSIVYAKVSIVILNFLHIYFWITASALFYVRKELKFYFIYNYEYYKMSKRWENGWKICTGPSKEKMALMVF